MTVFRRFGLLAPLAALSLASCGLNSVPTAEEKVNEAWANLQGDYQRRANLVDNLAATVKGAAAHERGVFVDVTNARARAGSVQLSAADLEDPAKVQQFAAAQQQLSAAVRPLLGPMVFERYPELKAVQNFTIFQDQLERMENRILVSVRDYNSTVREYNTRIRTFPDAIGAKVFYGAKPKVPFQATAGAQTAPKVDFGNAS